MTIKPKTPKKPHRKKGTKSLTTTSVAFKAQNLAALKKHELHTKKDLSISWIINKMIEKFLTGGFTLE